MNGVAAVFDGHALAGARGDGVNAYYYRRDQLSDRMLLVRRFEALPPGGNRVLAGVEVIMTSDADVSDALSRLEETPIEEGEHTFDDVTVRINIPTGSVRAEQYVRSILGTFRILGQLGDRLDSPLVFERSADAEAVRYSLSDESRERLSHLPDITPTSVTLTHDVRAAFEDVHGAFERQLAFAALPGLNWGRLAEFGGYVVLEQGEEVFRWPHFNDSAGSPR